jgi:hypothetical protein
VGPIWLDNGALITEPDRTIYGAIGDGQVTSVTFQQTFLLLLIDGSTKVFQFGWRQSKLKRTKHVSI